MKEISVKTSGRSELIDITAQVSAFVKESNLQDGFVVIFVPHTTAGVTINANADPSV